MKYILIIIFLTITSLSSALAKDDCKGVLAKLKSECNVVGKSMKKMKDFSSKNKTIGQSLGISKEGEKKKSMREISKENKTIDQTFRNIKEKIKKKDGN